MEDEIMEKLRNISEFLNENSIDCGKYGIRIDEITNSIKTFHGNIKNSNICGNKLHITVRGYMKLANYENGEYENRSYIFSYEKYDNIHTIDELRIESECKSTSNVIEIISGNKLFSIYH